MKIKSIYSNRFTDNKAYLDIVYEWEDDLAKSLGIQIQPIELEKPFLQDLGLLEILNDNFKKIISALSKKKHKPNSKHGSKHLQFVINAGIRLSQANLIKKNILPIIIDFWKQQDVHQFYEEYKYYDLIFISSLEVLTHLKRCKIPLNFHHLPLSLSDRFKDAAVGEKTYDIVLAGRRNELLWDYLQEFCIKYRDIEFLYQEEEDGTLYYRSNKRGRMGSYQSRKEYLALINSAFISFYSTPGIDGGEERTGGFNPVTPRFLELLSAKCLLLGRYPDNEETKFFEVAKVCPNINTYQEFEATLIKYFNVRNSPIDFSHYESILDKHYTSKRYLRILDVIQEK